MRMCGSFLCLVALLMNLGCGGTMTSTGSVPFTTPGGSSAPPAPEPSYSDQSWHFVALPAPAIEASLLFSGSSVTGIARTEFVTGSGPCIHFDDEILITGSVDASNQVHLTGSVDAGYGPTITIIGTLSQDRSSIANGTYQFTKSCAEGYSGSITAVKVAPVAGHYAGTLSDGKVTLSVSADLTQEKPALASGYFPVSGTLTIAGPACAGTYNLGGLAIGNYIKFSSNSLLEGVSATVDPAGQQLTLNDYLYSDDCAAGYQGVLQRQ